MQEVLLCFNLVIVPILLGVLWLRFWGKQGNFRQIYIWGYAIYGASFFVFAWWPVQQQWKIESIAYGWQIVQILYMVSALSYLRLKGVKLSILQCAKAIREQRGVLLLAMLVAFGSVLLIVPHLHDYVPAEIVKAESLDRPFFAVIYGGRVEDTVGHTTYLYLLYTILGKVSNISGSRTCMFIAPFFLYPLFYFVYAEVADQLFKRSDERSCFLLLLTVGYIVMIFAEPYIGLAAMQNIWNGKTLFTSVWVPFSYAVLMPQLKLKRHKNKSKHLAANMLVLALNVQLGYRYGAVQFIGIICLGSILFVLYDELSS